MLCTSTAAMVWVGCGFVCRFVVYSFLHADTARGVSQGGVMLHV
jgi:hypothetical protein